MIAIAEYLSQFPEDMPEWLAEYRPADKISFANVMSSRIAYYPGFGSDGTLLEAVNPSHSVHSYIFTDYLNKRNYDLVQLRNIKGYHSIGHVDWEWEEIMPNGDFPLNVKYRFELEPEFFSKHQPNQHYMTEIYERNEEDDSIGPGRIAITILCKDGIDAYYQLFIRQYDHIPWVFLLQDHGSLGCNYDYFGKGGLLDLIMVYNCAYPRYTICENGFGTVLWDRYSKIEEVTPIVGGMHHSKRSLYVKD